ncbi:MAG: DUF4105 domain-containing protein [Bacteroidaceae bacterium]|nr:DUF4105 domain-containing protein [Bacteroidaceae bacterium]
MDSTTNPVLPTDVYAYYVVVTPGNTFTSMLGHAAIRMECPSAGLDYCFTIKSPEIGNEFVAMTLRTLRAGLVPEKTAQFYHDYESEGRKVTEYKLNLTIDEVRHLWKLLDGYVAQGLYRKLDYIHHGCAQEMASMIFAAVPERGLDVDAIANELLPYKNRRQILARYMNPCWWKGFIGHSLYGGSPDEPVTGANKLIMPLDVVAALQKAKILQTTTALSLTPPIEGRFRGGSVEGFSPFRFAVLFLLLCLVPWSTPLTHYTLWTLHFLVGLSLVWIVFVSKTPGTEWNWFLIPFCPLPFLLLHWTGRHTYLFYSLVLLAFLLFMLVNLGKIFFIEQVLIVTGILIRTIYHIQTLSPTLPLYGEGDHLAINSKT